MLFSAEKNKQKKMRGFFPFGKLRVRMTTHTLRMTIHKR